MLTSVCRLLSVLLLLPLAAFDYGGTTGAEEPQYTTGGDLKLPTQYREWVYLSTGFDMSYTEGAGAASDHVFDNVFVNPAAYKAFLESGTWPDKTVMVLENRGAEGKGSINQSGHFQSARISGVEIHVKDKGRFQGDWAFFGFGTGNTGKMFPRAASCYGCHAEHAAVDTTFVQFYPTLLSTAQTKHTLSAAYLKELASDKR